MYNMRISELFTSAKFRLPRKWSNRVLSLIGGFFDGEVINVSAWEDSDKEGKKYREYFCNAKNYYVSNFGGERGVSDKSDYFIDLETDLQEELKNRFDVVFNHTTLEHTFDVFKAVKNLCDLSRDIVIVIVPFVQETHASSSFKDYWRFTHHSLESLFELNKFKVVYLTSTPYQRSSIYHFCVASRHPEKWENRFRDCSAVINSGTELVKNGFFNKLLFISRYLLSKKAQSSGQQYKGDS